MSVYRSANTKYPELRFYARSGEGVPDVRLVRIEEDENSVIEARRRAGV
jgi:hypothetical protein